MLLSHCIVKNQCNGISMARCDFLFSNFSDSIRHSQEDTQHLLSCRNRTSRNEASTQLWISIWEDIASKQQNTKPATLKKSKISDTKPDPKLLKPFALRTDPILHPPSRLSGRGGFQFPTARSRGPEQLPRSGNGVWPDPFNSLTRASRTLVALRTLLPPHWPYAPNAP
jgi:hypothetical protein